MSKNTNNCVSIVIGVGDDTILLSKPLNPNYWFWAHLIFPDGRVYKIGVANIAGSIVEVSYIMDNNGGRIPLQEIPVGAMCAVQYIFDFGNYSQEYLEGKYNWWIRRMMYRFGITEYQLPQKQKKKKR